MLWIGIGSAVGVQNASGQVTAGGGIAQRGDGQAGLRPRVDAVADDPVGPDSLIAQRVELALGGVVLGDVGQPQPARAVGDDAPLDQIVVHRWACLAALAATLVHADRTPPAATGADPPRGARGVLVLGLAGGRPARLTRHTGAGAWRASAELSRPYWQASWHFARIVASKRDISVTGNPAGAWRHDQSCTSGRPRRVLRGVPGGRTTCPTGSATAPWNTASSTTPPVRSSPTTGAEHSHRNRSATRPAPRGSRAQRRTPAGRMDSDPRVAAAHAGEVGAEAHGRPGRHR
ncbi:hypothetical protein FB564_1851 [Salinispora arenicola]|uniref:Uncharacterized protein n=1 Tax=Salinispora arenicola TaxID=168697 RepID=A0A542XLK3_SALAC|nr:hypothetical protein FB564_1851 [Salinispora arenicola]